MSQYAASGNMYETYLYGNVARERVNTDDARFVTYEGGRDSRAAGMSRDTIMQRAKAAIAAVAVVMALGFLAVFLTSNTVAILQANSQMSSEIQELTDLNSELRIECSLLSRSERIAQIATQNLGMMYASEAQPLSLN
jgi:cell division protein FtsL